MRIEGNSLNSLVFQSCKEMLEKAQPIHSRNGLCWELIDVDLFLTNPKNRYLYLKGRTNNPFATMFETIWVFSGKSEIKDLLVFIPRAKDYSDDGKTWRGAYGKRIYRYEQINSIVEHFINDLNTRRAVMTIWQPELDTQEAIRFQGYENSKDIPCSQWLGFWIRDNKLFTKFQMRSNDLIFGFSHINVFEFTTLQEIIKTLIEANVGVKLDFGYYHHSVVSFHLYDFSREQAEKILSNPENYSNLLPKRMNSLFPECLKPSLKKEKDIRDLFNIAYNYCVSSKLISEHSLLEEGISPESELYWWVRFSNLYYVLKDEIDSFIKEAEKLNEVCYLIGNEELACSVGMYLDRLKSKLRFYKSE